MESGIHSPNISVCIRVFCCCVLTGKSGVMLQSKCSSRSKAWGPHAYSTVPSSHHSVSDSSRWNTSPPSWSPHTWASRSEVAEGPGSPRPLCISPSGRSASVSLHPPKGSRTNSLQSYGPPMLYPSYQRPPLQALPHPNWLPSPCVKPSRILASWVHDHSLLFSYPPLWPCV